MTDQDPAGGNAAYRDRKTGLVLFGILQIVLGGICALFLPMMLMGALVGQVAEEAAAPQPSLRMMIPGMMFYLVAAVWFIWLGFGSILARRWARALILTASWIALICGTAGMVFWAILSPQIYGHMAASGDLPQEAVKIIQGITAVFLGVIYVIGPAVFVLFYGSPHVKATCEANDPQPRWTDTCPLPVLGLSLMFAMWGLSLLSMGCYNFAMPFFGTIVSGRTGAAVCLALAILGCWTAWGTYKLKIAAWWTGTLATLSFCFSFILTFSRTTLAAYYEVMEFPKEQLELLQGMDFGTSMMVVPMLITTTLFLGYLLFTRRYFRPQAADPSP